MRDLVYWECPCGTTRVLISGFELASQVPILDMEPFAGSMDESLIPFLPDGWLNQAESAVERHEATHLEGS